MIIIGGDVSPSGFSERCLSQNPEILFKPSLKKFLAQAENVVINLETVITKSNQPIVKCGPNFKCKPDVAAGLKSLNILNCSLANNHIMDYGEIGLKDTMGCLNDEGINYWGAGLSINELASYCIFPMSGKRVAIVSIAEHEFSIISNNDAGAYGLDIIDNGTLISQLAQENDVPLLSQIPIESDTFSGTGKDLPVVHTSPDSITAKVFLELAGTLCNLLSVRH